MLRVNHLTGFGAFTASGGGGGAPTDPSIASVGMLLGFEGANGAATGTPGFNDESITTNKGGATANTGAPVISAAQFRYGATSVYLSGGACMSWADSADFDFNSGLFTVECSLRTGTVTAGVRYICGQWQAGNQGWMLFQDGDAIKWMVSTTGSDSFTDLASGVGDLVANTWLDVSIDFDGSSYRMYLNGVLEATFATPRTLFNSGGSLLMGANVSGTNALDDAYLDEVRITKGVARYAGVGYTPAAFPRS